MVRVRFAPSPTGRLHIGGMRTALFNWLFAKHNNGKFILRIEDTDRTRFQEGAFEEILEAFKWFGIDFDEGPNKSGMTQSYIQSERLSLYKEHADVLLKKGLAYKCFCTSERLTKMREIQQSKKLPPRYDRHCLNLSKDEIKKLEDAQTPFVIRLKVPDEGFVEFKDMIRGKVRFYNKEIDDQVLIKSDGFPTYHLAVVVDDHLMNITHVFRAEEWLPSTPKHILLYKAFGFQMPELGHLPMIVNEQRKKLSKRDGSTAFLDYRDQGYLAESLMNFLVFLGWNPKTEKEIFTRDELISEFDPKNINKAPSVFDIKKLDWINGLYIRKMNINKLVELSKPYLQKVVGDISSFKDDYIKSAVLLEQERIKKINEIGESIAFFFIEPKYEGELLIGKKMDKSTTLSILKTSLEDIQKFEDVDFKRDSLEEKLRKVCETKNIKPGNMFWPLRAALSGRDKSPGVFEIMELLGKEKTISRVKLAIEKLS